jgi:hypothetical protein
MGTARLVADRGSGKVKCLHRSALTPIMLQLRAIETWDGMLQQVSGGATPFIDISSMMGK